MAKRKFRPEPPEREFSDPALRLCWDVLDILRQTAAASRADYQNLPREMRTVGVVGMIEYWRHAESAMKWAKSLLVEMDKPNQVKRGRKVKRSSRAAR